MCTGLEIAAIASVGASIYSSYAGGKGDTSSAERQRGYAIQAEAKAKADEEYAWYKENIRDRQGELIESAFDDTDRYQSEAQGDFTKGERIANQGVRHQALAMGVNASDLPGKTSSDMARRALGMTHAGEMGRRRQFDEQRALIQPNMGMGQGAISTVTQIGLAGKPGGASPGGGGGGGGGGNWGYSEDQGWSFGGGFAHGGPVRRLITPEESLYNDAAYWASLDDAVQGEEYAKSGHAQGYAGGGHVRGYQEGGEVEGPGTGTSDSVPASIDGIEPARLSDGEFVVPADVVEYLGQKYFYDQINKARKEIQGGGGAEGGKRMAAQQSGGGQNGARRQAA